MLTLVRFIRCNGFGSALLALSALIVLALSAGALADKVVMKSGNTFEGEVVEEKETEIVLKMQYGTMTFQKDQIKSITKGKYSPPKPSSAPAAGPTDATAPIAPPIPGQDSAAGKDEPATTLPALLSKVDKAVKARQFEVAIDLLEKAKERPGMSSAENAAAIEAKLKKVKEQALVLIEINIEKVFVPEDARDPAARRDKDAEPVSDTGIKREVEEALTAMFERALQQKGFIPVTKGRGQTKRIQKLKASYSETGGAAYLDNEGNVVGNRIEARCHIELAGVSGGTTWSGDIEAITPDMIRHGSPRDETLYLLGQKAQELGFGVSE